MGMRDLLGALLRRGDSPASPLGSDAGDEISIREKRMTPIVRGLESRLLRAFSEPPLRVVHVAGEELSGPLAASAARGNRLIALGDGDSPLSTLVAASIIDGLQNGFGLVEPPLWPAREGGGANARGDVWRYIPTDLIKTNPTRHGRREALELQRPSSYQLGVEAWTPDELIKLRFEYDSAATWRGYSNLDSLGTVIFAEFAALEAQARTIANSTEGHIAAISGGGTDDQFKQKVQSIKKHTTGRGRGGTSLIEAHGLSALQRLGFDPNWVRFNDQQMAHESYAGQLYGVPPPVFGGLLGQATYSRDNYRSARRAFFRELIRPLWTETARRLTTQWLHRFIDDSPELAVEYDLSGVEALQEDRDEAAARIGQGWRDATATWNQYADAMGLPTHPNGDVLRIGQDFLPVDDVLGPAPDG